MICFFLFDLCPCITLFLPDFFWGIVGEKIFLGFIKFQTFKNVWTTLYPVNNIFRCLTLVRPYFFRENSIFHICQYKDDCAKVFLVQRSNALDSIIGSLPQERSREFSPRFEEKNIFPTSSNICLNLLFESLYPKKTLWNWTELHQSWRAASK